MCEPEIKPMHCNVGNSKMFHKTNLGCTQLGSGHRLIKCAVKWKKSQKEQGLCSLSSPSFESQCRQIQGEDVSLLILSFLQQGI